jgi:phenolic acid decarboxylase
MTSVANSTPPQDLSGIVGHRFVYTYANGWQ